MAVVAVAAAADEDGKGSVGVWMDVDAYVRVGMGGRTSGMSFSN